MNSDLLLNLTDAQRAAVTHMEDPLLVLAGPGSGKTRVVTHRVAWLLEQGVEAQALLVLTFTNKAADEMKVRVERMVGQTDVWISTFHRFCARMLRQYAPLVGLEPSYSIYDTRDVAGAIRKVTARLKETRGNEFGDVVYSPDSLAHSLSTLKNRYLSMDEYQPAPLDQRGEFLKALWPLYQEQLRDANAVDFDDLLLLTVQLLRQNPDLRHRLDTQFQFVLVDEYQDTNLAQYTLSRLLATDVPNLMVTGDPDQSIYAWRGAEIRNIPEFERDNPKARTIRLEQNYRSTPNILAAADALIRHNHDRKAKRLFTQNAAGLPVRLRRYPTAEAEAAGIAEEIADAIRERVRQPSDFAIFYRVNALSVEFEKALRLRRIPFRILHGTEFFERTEVRDILAYLRLLENPHDNEAFSRVVNVPSRGIGKTTLEHLADYAWNHGLSLWEAARQAEDCEALKKRAKAALAEFVALMFQLRGDMEATEGKITPLVRAVLERTRYAEQFADEKETLFSEEDLQKRRNLDAVIQLATQYDAEAERPSLRAFLEQSSLTGDTDERTDGANDDAVSLMTLHAAKGLEFPVVYLTAVEHGILPHERSSDDDAEQEEERRLMFVGMTRAKEELTLTYAEERSTTGLRRCAAPSRFLTELPLEEMDTNDALEENGAENGGLNDGFEPIPEDDYCQDVPAGFVEPEPHFEVEPEPDVEQVPDEEEASSVSRSRGRGRRVKPSKPLLSNIPGLMTGADLLKGAKKQQTGEDF